MVGYEMLCFLHEVILCEISINEYFRIHPKMYGTGTEM
jgi:hypothetical protein